ncbi:MAG: ATP synthase F1 subunit gamma [Anaerolineae bacterium]
MANVREIGRRISTVRSLAQVTRAMQMVSASRMRKAQERVLAARPYAEKTQELLRRLATAAGESSHPLLRARPVRRLAIALIASDRGLCGSYNSNVARLALRYARQAGVPVSYVTVGSEARRAVLAAGGELLAEFGGIPSDLTIGFAAPIARVLEEAFLAGEVDAAMVAYTEFRSVVSQVPKIIQLLPVLPVAPGDGAASEARELAPNGGSRVEYIHEPAAGGILDTLVPQSVEVAVLGCLLEAAASEHSARMVAMQNATQNASDQIEALTRAFNRARQTAITGEILDIASATEAQRAG